MYRPIIGGAKCIVPQPKFWWGHDPRNPRGSVPMLNSER